MYRKLIGPEEGAEALDGALDGMPYPRYGAFVAAAFFAALRAAFAAFFAAM
jgi:hypothetical protein